MRPRIFNLAALLGCCLLAFVSQRVLAADPVAVDTPPPLGASLSPVGDTPPAAASPAATAKPGKKPKPPRDPNATPKPVRIKKPKEIPFPVPIGEPASNVNLPENSLTGELMMRLMSIHMTRISNELVQMEQSTLDFKQPDGKEDFHVVLPKSVFNLQTHMVHSDDPVTVRTQDFELTGEKMEFDTVERTGKLIGHVHMTIHNLKQVAGLQQPSPTP